MSNLMSMRAYAKYRGVSPEAVSKAVRTGRISTITVDDKGTRKIDPAIADKEWSDNSEGVRPNYGIPSSEEHQGEPDESQERQQRLSVGKSVAYLKAYQVKLAKLEFDEKSGKLVDAEAVKRESFRVARATRDALMSIPDRLAPELAGETDQFTIRKRLEDEIRQALQNLSATLEVEPA